MQCFKNRYKRFAVTMGIYGHLNYLPYTNSITSEHPFLCRLSFPFQMNISGCIYLYIYSCIYIYMLSHLDFFLGKKQEIIRQYCCRQKKDKSEGRLLLDKFIWMALWSMNAMRVESQQKTWSDEPHGSCELLNLSLSATFSTFFPASELKSALPKFMENWNSEQSLEPRVTGYLFANIFLSECSLLPLLKIIFIESLLVWCNHCLSGTSLFAAQKSRCELNLWTTVLRFHRDGVKNVLYHMA